MRGSFLRGKGMGSDMFPEAFLEKMKQLLGAEYDEFVKALEQDRHRALRLNKLKPGFDGQNAADVFAVQNDSQKNTQLYTTKTFAHLSKVPWAEDGYYYQSDQQPGKHPYHEAGLYYIQEPSAMAPVELLKVQPGERILDLCAAPGGKSTQIAAKLQGKGLLLCNEIHPARAKILSGNIERMGICNAIVTNEQPKHLAELFPEYFDKILVDAPCSGEGMFRKNQTACEEWSPENVVLCAERQDEILDEAAKMLRPGGQLVYSTCTFAPLENEGSISRFLERHDDFALLPIDKSDFLPSICDGVPEWGNGMPELCGTLRLWPQRIEGEGHFAALLQKAGGVPDNYEPRPAAGIIPEVPEKELEEFSTFCKENLLLPVGDLSAQLCSAIGMDNDTSFIKFGDNLYLIPTRLRSLKGIKVLRPGLHLGELKKNRFEPSHALALALSPKNAARIWNLSSDSAQVTAYLNGQTFPAEGEKGWYLICVDGFGLGWGKLAGGLMKNHYPKGLRINFNTVG